LLSFGAAQKAANQELVHFLRIGHLVGLCPTVFAPKLSKKKSTILEYLSTCHTDSIQNHEAT
jgi:hypothetical protein